MRNLIIFIFLLLATTVQSQEEGYLLSYRQGNSCTEFSGDVFPVGTATSNCDNEANALNGWASGNNAIVAVVASDEPDYEYAISIKTNDLATGYSRGVISIPVSNATTYANCYVTYKVVVADTGTNTEPRIDLWTGVDTSPSILLNTDGNIHTTPVFSILTTGTSVGTRFYNAYVPPVDSADVELMIYNVIIAP